MAARTLKGCVDGIPIYYFHPFGTNDEPRTVFYRGSWRTEKILSPLHTWMLGMAYAGVSPVLSWACAVALLTTEILRIRDTME